MEPAAGIRKLGFKRWFERQLIESHVYLATVFLCLILVIVVFEQLASSAGGLERTLMYAAMIGGSAAPPEASHLTHRDRWESRPRCRARQFFG